MKVFSGSSNNKLAKEIAKKLGLKLGKIELSRFSNGECRVYVKDKIINEKAVVVQSFSYPPDKKIIEFLLIADALHRKGIKKIIGVIPWMGYCIQDKVFREGEPLSSKVIAQILQTAKLDRIISLDLHNQVMEGFFDIPFTELFATYTLIDWIKKQKTGIDTIISPDVGALKKATRFAQSFELPLVVINKKRDLETGKITISNISDPVKGKKVLIVDDFLSTGQTLIQTAKFLHKKGVKKIYACLTHHFYIPGVQEKVEASFLDKLFITDTIIPLNRIKYKKIKIISVGDIIAEAIKKYI